MPKYRVCYWVIEARITEVTAMSEEDAQNEVALGNEGEFQQIGIPRIEVESAVEVENAKV